MKENIKAKPQKNILFQLFLALPLSLIIFGMVLIMLLVGFEVVYANRVYPGIYMHDLDLSGLTVQEASQQLAEALPYTHEGQLVFTYKDQSWNVRPIDLGFLVEPTFSAQRAYETGRKGWLPMNLIEKSRAWFTGVQLSPVAYFDEQMAQLYLQAIASEIDQPLKEASLGLENADVIVKSGQVGREVDISATLALIRPILMDLKNGEISLVVTETSPEILDVGAQAELARQILSEPLVLTVPGEDVSWSISPSDLGAMLTIKRADGSEDADLAYQISINEDLFGVYLNSLAPGLVLTPVNARFIFNDDTRQLEVIEPASIGRQLDLQESLVEINERILAGDHQIDLRFKTIQPAVTDDMTGEELGITEQVQSYTSYFYGSEPARVQNIRAASAEFHGLLIAPGETFSMASALGNISLENGYAEAPIIYGGQTIQGIGGGVCQVSTTLFRTAFYAGFPIVERYAHTLSRRARPS